MGTADVSLDVIGVSVRAHNIGKGLPMIRRHVTAADESPGVAGRADRYDDGSGFDEALESVLPKLWRLCLRLTSNHHDAEDLAAEALARAYASWGRIADLPYREGWILRTATNLAYDASRKRRRARWATNPQAGLEFEDVLVDNQLISGSLRRLPIRQREAVVLHHMAGCTVEETAAAMGISVASASTHLKRAMTALRSTVQDGSEGSQL
jgi:RNA polymerase sigma-70 factor (ECF subfamily)